MLRLPAAQYGLEKEVKVNIEANHATLAGHSFEHEIATAAALGILGSLDMNRGDMQSRLGHRPVPQQRRRDWARAVPRSCAPAASATAASTSTPRCAASRSTPADLFHGHVGGLDACAQALMAAARLIEDGKFDAFLNERYAGWADPKAQAMLTADATLDGIAARAAADKLDPKPRSGRQEWVENLLNRYL